MKPKNNLKGWSFKEISTLHKTEVVWVKMTQTKNHMVLAQE